MRNVNQESALSSKEAASIAAAGFAGRGGQPLIQCS
jgi:hypothetical protein